MTPSEYAFISGYLKERSGLALPDNKEYLVQSRLGPIIRDRELGGMTELVALLRRGTDRKLEAEVVEAMTTNESFFFRDKLPFDLMRDYMLPQLLSRSRPPSRLRIWCCAASTGQEPYSIAILLNEMRAKLGNVRCEIVATDISTKVIERARSGIYSQFEVQRGLPITLLMKYFKQTGDQWQVNEAVRSAVKFEYCNLLEGLSRMGKFDIVFCRNVLIYFDEATKRDVLARVAAQMNPGAYMVLGAAETIMGLSDRLKPVPGQRCLITLPDTSAVEMAPSRPLPRLSATAG